MRTNRNLGLRAGVLLLGMTFASNAPAGGQAIMPKPGAWSGVVINSGCTVDEAFAEAAKCTEKVPGGPLVLYDDTTRQIFNLDPQTPAIGHLGDSVTVHGQLEADTIRVASLDLLGSIGLPIGQKAPLFSALDQFGHKQTLESLRGPQGTVLLFFRSADW